MVELSHTELKKFDVWEILFFYSDNDVTDTTNEYANAFYHKYINDKNFSQNLKNIFKLIN